MPNGQAQEQLAEAIRQLPDDAIPDLGISIERKEHYRAELAKIDAMHRRDELGSIADMKREAFGLAKSVREAVLGDVKELLRAWVAERAVADAKPRLRRQMACHLRTDVRRPLR
jgi:hypothetical protein